MAEKNDQQKALTCQSVNDVRQLFKRHIQEYNEFLQENLTEHTGLLSNCSHPDVASTELKQLKEILEDIKAHTESHVHVDDPSGVIRGENYCSFN